MKKRGIGFHHALRGLWVTVRHGRNMRICLTAAVFAVTAGILGRIEPWAWAAVSLCCGAVLSAELLNSALESLCDRVSTEKNEFIRNAKDMAAGAVLLAAAVSVVVAVIVFGRSEILENLMFWRQL